MSGGAGMSDVRGDTTIRDWVGVMLVLVDEMICPIGSEWMEEGQSVDVVNDRVWQNKAQVKSNHISPRSRAIRVPPSTAATFPDSAPTGLTESRADRFYRMTRTHCRKQAEREL